jgi:peptidoglycan/xylan/chitin deacetylase (PgdA/CDA1 family)
VVETIRRGTPVQERIFALTFDDAYEGLFYHALPVLREASWPAAVFVVTDYIGNENSWDVNIGWRRFRHLDWPMMRQMSDAGITFGSHTVSHPDLTRLSVKQIRYELERSRRDLEDGLGKRVEFLSYPFGRYNRTVQHLAQEAGYVAAFGNYPRGRNSDPDWLALPRAGVYLMDAVSEILVKADPDPHPVLFACEDLKGRGISFLAQGTPLTKALLPKKALTSALPKR